VPEGLREPVRGQDVVPGRQQLPGQRGSHGAGALGPDLLDSLIVTIESLSPAIGTSTRGQSVAPSRTKGSSRLIGGERQRDREDYLKSLRSF
jgi:hypothetical protein